MTRTVHASIKNKVELVLENSELQNLDLQKHG